MRAPFKSVGALAARLARVRRWLARPAPQHAARVAVDAYPLNATGWGTGGWPWL